MNAIAPQVFRLLRRLGVGALAALAFACSGVSLSAAVETVQIEAGVPVKIVCETITDVAPVGGFFVAKISITNGTQGPLAWRAAPVPARWRPTGMLALCRLGT